MLRRIVNILGFQVRITVDCINGQAVASIFGAEQNSSIVPFYFIPLAVASNTQIELWNSILGLKQVGATISPVLYFNCIRKDSKKNKEDELVDQEIPVFIYCYHC